MARPARPLGRGHKPGLARPGPAGRRSGPTGHSGSGFGAPPARRAEVGPMTATEAEMFALADQLGVHVARHRLNGRPRYRFFAAPMDFSAGEGMGTVIGTRAALTWLRGYEAARPFIPTSEVS